MTQYVDYSYYINTYGGCLIPQNIFDKFAIKGTFVINNRILGKDITGFEDIVKQTCCEIAEELYNQNQNENKIKEVANGESKIITSEKVGDYSRNFSSAGVSELKTLVDNSNTKINTIIDENLLMTGLLYAGLVDVR